MNVSLSTAWAAEARADGATRQTLLLDALRMNNLNVMSGELRPWCIVGVFATMEEAMAHNRELKRAVNRRRKRSPPGHENTKEDGKVNGEQYDDD